MAAQIRRRTMHDSMISVFIVVGAVVLHSMRTNVGTPRHLLSSTLPPYDGRILEQCEMLIGQTVRRMVVRRRTIMKSTISSVKNQMKQKRMATENDNNNKRSSHISRTTTATIGSFIRGIKLRHHRPGM